MAALGLGVDTGGTYTDSAVVDLDTGRLLSKSKALTTYEDLSEGIEASMRGLDASLFPDVRTVSLSSTLATNSVVEGRGCPVALVAIGADFDGSIDVARSVRIGGGHDIYGKEIELLDVDAARRFLESLGGEVGAVAVTSFMGVANPHHENVVKAMAEEITGLPVVCGHELSSDLGFNERAVTAVMNVRLIPIVREMIASMRRVLARNGIDAPLMIVKGDGSVMTVESALERPVETIISGPAASLVGARALAGLDDAIVMDMGGTTTDIGVLRGGSPRMSGDGAVIGGRRTRVAAADISTYGIGGDSRLAVCNGRLCLSPRRAVPLCIAASERPEILGRLRAASAREPRRTFYRETPETSVMEVEFFMRVRDSGDPSLGGVELGFYDFLKGGPATVQEAADALGVHPFTIPVEGLEAKGLVKRIGVTPTDILHATGEYVRYCREASELGVACLARRAGEDPAAFAAHAKAQVVEVLARALLSKLVSDRLGQSAELGAVGADLVRMLVTGEAGEDYSCSMRVSKPVVGMGAPAAAYLPLAAERLGTRCVLPPDCDVGCAVGAVAGCVMETAVMTVRPARGLGSLQNPRSVVTSRYGTWEFQTLDEAVAFARDEGTRRASEAARRSGAPEVEVRVERHDDRTLDIDGSTKELASIRFEVTAVGKARLAATRAPRQGINRRRQCGAHGGNQAVHQERLRQVRLREAEAP